MILILLSNELDQDFLPLEFMYELGRDLCRIIYVIVSIKKLCFCIKCFELLVILDFSMIELALYNVLRKFNIRRMQYVTCLRKLSNIQKLDKSDV